MSNEEKISKTLCVFAWRQVHVTPIGVVKPCCIFDKPLLDENGKTIRINDASIEEIWNSKAFKEIRTKMIKGEEISGCIKCYEEEKISNTSDRIRTNKHSGLLPEVLKEIKPDGSVDQLPTLINLKIGNICNLKCRMCQPLDSCMVDSEFSQISKTEPRFRSFDNANAFDYNYDDQAIEFASNWINDELAKTNMKLLLSKTKEISLAGGETTFTTEIIDLLKYCVENSLSKNIELIMSTNLTRMADSFIDMLSNFKNVRVVCSIDGTMELAEYIRFPSKWDVIRHNLQKLINAPYNVVPVLAPTIQIYNILDCVKIFDLAEELYTSKWDIFPPYHITILFDPQHLSIRHLPANIKKIALDRLLEFEKRSLVIAKKNRESYAQFQLLKQTLMQEDFDLNNGLSSRDYLAHFLQYTQDLDKQRNQKFENYLPELYKLLAAENITPAYPKNNPQNFTYFKFRDNGFRLQGEKKTEEALLYFYKAYEMYQDDQNLLISMGHCHREKSEFAKALSFFYKSYEILSDDFDLILAISHCHRELGEFEKALSFFNKAHEINPEDADLLFSIGHCYRELGEIQKSFEYFEKVYTLKPSHFFNLIDMGYYFQYQKNDPIKALGFFTQAQKYAQEEHRGLIEEIIKKAQVK